MSRKIIGHGFDNYFDERKDIIISGGYSKGFKDFSEYLNRFPSPLRDYLEKIKDYILENKLQHKTGEEMNGNYFLTNADFKIMFTWRAWGDLVSSINAKGENYMSYYM